MDLLLHEPCMCCKTFAAWRLQHSIEWALLVVMSVREVMAKQIAQLKRYPFMLAIQACSHVLLCPALTCPKADIPFIISATTLA